MSETAYTCIVCPVSCRISVREEGGELTISGSTCKRGEDFARNEHVNPMRILTSTVKLEGGRFPRLPVISRGEIPKAKLRECLNEVYRITASAPVKCGDVLIENVCGTGVDIVASRSA
ncbi:MAG: DUF1667 domain-containing protein [Christensenellales bacterium]